MSAMCNKCVRFVLLNKGNSFVANSYLFFLSSIHPFIHLYMTGHLSPMETHNPTHIKSLFAETEI